MNQQQTQTAHTPGPWWKPGGSAGIWCDAGMVAAVASPAMAKDAGGRPAAPNVTEAAANAQLIAAAPDLLELAFMVAGMRPGESISEAKLDRASAAIAKATD